MNNEKCTFCETTNFFISEEYKTSLGHFFVDVRFDIDEADFDENKGHGRHEIDVNFGLLDDNDGVSDVSWWTKALNIKYCPICGRKLK